MKSSCSHSYGCDTFIILGQFSNKWLHWLISIFKEHFHSVVQQEGGWVGAHVAVLLCTTDIFRFLTSFFNTLIKGDSWYVTAVLYWWCSTQIINPVYISTFSFRATFALKSRTQRIVWAKTKRDSLRAAWSKKADQLTVMIIFFTLIG